MLLAQPTCNPSTSLQTAHTPPSRLFGRPAGQTGLGKSTLINTIFASHLIDTKGRFEPDEPVRQTTEIQAVSHSESHRRREKVGLVLCAVQ